MASLAEQFKAKIPASLSSDTSQRKLNGFIKKSIKDQRGLLKCLKEFSKAFRAGWDRYDESQVHRGLAILYSLFTRAIALAGPMNDLADLVLYIAQLARELNGGPKGKLSLSLPSPEDIDHYLGYSVLWNQMPEKDRNDLEQEALKKRGEIREPRTLITELVIAYSKKNNGQTPSLEQIYDFDPAGKTPREDLDKALEACNASWLQFSRADPERSPSAPVEKNMKRLDDAFDRLRRLLLRSGSEPLVFFQLMKWIRDGARPNVRWTGPESDQYMKEATPSWTNIWAEVYLEACFCAIRLAMSKWDIYRIQKTRGISQKDLDFLLGPVNLSERDKFEMRIAWGSSNPKGFEACNRVRRRMNRFAEASALTHLDEFETVALVNKIAEVKQNNPEQMEAMIAEASSRRAVFNDKHRVGQQILDSFTIVWTDQQNQGARIIVEFHNMPCELFSTTPEGLGDLVQNAFWRKMAELSDQIIRFLLAYLEVLGLVVDVISAGTANGFRQMVFEFVKEQMKEKASDAVLDAFHIDNPALHTVAGVWMNLVRIRPKAKGQHLEPSNPEIAGQRQAAVAGGRREPEFPKEDRATHTDVAAQRTAAVGPGGVVGSGVVAGEPGPRRRYAIIEDGRPKLVTEAERNVFESARPKAKPFMEDVIARYVVPVKYSATGAKSWFREVFVGAGSKDDFRNDLTKILNKDPKGPLSQALLKNKKLAPGGEKGHDEIYWAEHPELIEAGHVLSENAGGPDLLIVMSAHHNRKFSKNLETGAAGVGKPGQLLVEDAYVIQGVAVHKGTAHDLVRDGKLDAEVVRQAEIIRFVD